MKFSLVLMVAAHSAASVFAAEPFKISTKKTDDSLEVVADKDKALFTLKSATGIGEATIERTIDKWPDSIKLRLHLLALESFSVTNGKDSLQASVSQGMIRVWKNGKEDEPLNEKSEFWMPIQRFTTDGKPTEPIPLKKGYFDISLPKAFFAGNPKSMTLHWIDFYRR